MKMCSCRPTSTCAHVYSHFHTIVTGFFGVQTVQTVMLCTIYSLFIRLHTLVNLFVREAATPIRWTAAGLIWLSGSWTRLILDKSAQSPVLITTILGKKLKLIQEHGSCCCRRKQPPSSASFPVWEQEPFGRSSRWLSDSRSAFINLAEIMCFFFFISFCLSISLSLSVCLFHSLSPSIYTSVNFTERLMWWCF